MIEVRRSDPADPAVAGLLKHHFDDAHATTSAAFRFVLGPAALSEAGVAFFTAWDGDALAGMGALKELGGGHAELKSMRTDPAHLRKGVGAAILTALIGEARERGVERLSLETGTSDDFAPARALYRRFGFVDCAAFADYPADSPHNCYMMLSL